MNHPSSTILQLLREYRFDSVIPIVTQTLRDAAAESPQRLSEVSRDIVRWQGIFKNTAQAMTSEPYFRTVYSILVELAGPESPVAMAAAENLAGVLGSIDKVDEAISLRERVLDHLRRRYASDDPRVMNVRDGLSILYRRAGRHEKLETIYRDTAVCEHLQAADRFIREHGAHVISAGQPWSANCHVWIYFDALLDCDRLIKGLGLASCVQIHDHRGTHDGSERGIVCTIHNDGLMGPHPEDASPAAKTVSVS
jgi:hypothetical protein